MKLEQPDTASVFTYYNYGVIILFPQIFFSPRNVVSRIQQALDLLHSEVMILSLFTATQTPDSASQKQ